MPAALTLHHLPADPLPWQCLAPCGSYVAGFVSEAAARRWHRLVDEQRNSRDDDAG